jgi:hypothetical protein
MLNHCDLRGNRERDGRGKRVPSPWLDELITMFRVVPLLVVDGNIGTFPSRCLPMMDGLQRTISIPSELTNKAMIPGNGARK